MRFYLFNQHLLSCDYSFMWFTLSSSLINLNYIWKYNKLNMDFFISGTFHYYLCLLKVMSNNRGKNLCTNNWFSINVDVFWYVSVYECLIWWLEKKTEALKKMTDTVETAFVRMNTKPCLPWICVHHSDFIILFGTSLKHLVSGASSYNYHEETKNVYSNFVLIPK